MVMCGWMLYGGIHYYLVAFKSIEFDGELNV